LELVISARIVNLINEPYKFNIEVHWFLSLIWLHVFINRSYVTVVV